MSIIVHKGTDLKGAVANLVISVTSPDSIEAFKAVILKGSTDNKTPEIINLVNEVCGLSMELYPQTGGIPLIPYNIPERNLHCIKCNYLNHDIPLNSRTFKCKHCGLEQEK